MNIIIIMTRFVKVRHILLLIHFGIYDFFVLENYPENWQEAFVNSLKFTVFYYS